MECSEGDDRGEQAGGLASPGEEATELDGVDHGRLAAGARREVAARRPGQLERERFAVAAGPLGDDVGDDAPVVVTDLTSAETIKVASNVFLAAKITFANEISRLTAATGADAQDVVDGMGLDKRIVRNFLSPGPGFGGSCFPSQARALPRLAAGFGVQTPLMDAIWPSNVSQADWLLDGLERAAGRSLEGLRVALLGLTFNAGTDDLRESPAIRLGQALAARGATVVAYDPVSLERGTAMLQQLAPGAPIEGAPSAVAACDGAAAVVVATEWSEFGQLPWMQIAPTMTGEVVIDGRRVVDVDAAGAAGLRVVALGVEVSGAALELVD